MERINIDEFDNSKIILLYILNKYKDTKEKDFLLYTLLQEKFIINDIILNLLPYMLKLRDKINLKVLFPLCLIGENDYRRDFFYNKIHGYISRIIMKKDKECLKCSYYSNCIGIINSSFLPLPFYGKGKLIYWKDYKRKLTLLSEFLDKYLNKQIGLKIYFVQNLMTSYLDDLDLLNFNFFNYITIILEKEFDFLVGKNKNLFLKNNNSEFIGYIKKNFGFNLTFDYLSGLNNRLDLNIQTNSELIGSGKNKIYKIEFEKIFILDFDNYIHYIHYINELIYHIFIKDNKIEIMKEFLGKGYGKYCGELIFINMVDICNISKDFDKYVVCTNDNINYYIPEIYKFKYFITYGYNPLTHFSIIIREIKGELLYNINYNFLWNVKSFDKIYIDFKKGKVMKI